MDWVDIFYQLLHAESEAEVLKTLARHKLLDSDTWRPLGDVENNLSIVANQHVDPTGALVEKIINAIDAKLLAACFDCGIDPEGDRAPATMAEAVDVFFGVKQGQLGELGSKQLTNLALGIQLVATGSKDDPSYLIVDDGEGQTPTSFPDTFLSLAKSNKIRIPFVQGKFNAGGTGVLQFCGNENLQLIVSRRQPKAPAKKGDATRDLWGFTVVRRIEPPPGDRRRSSMYVYLAPDKQVPFFNAASIAVLPGDSRNNTPPEAYKEHLQYGTVIKLYNYRWKPKSIATTDARFELEKYLHSPSLPFRITETRSYRANYYSATVSGIWASIDPGGIREDRQRLEDGFPAYASLNLETIGTLGYKVAAFKDDVDYRRVPHGIFFAINGQVHGSLPVDFVSRRLEFEYLRNYLLVSVDCTQMRNRVREDFFMASRDRLRQNEVYEEIISQLEVDLKNHPGLRALNAARRAKALEKALDDQEGVTQTFHELLRMDPTLRSLFNPGDRLITNVGPTEPPKFEGRRFPTYFQIASDPKGVIVKRCPVNRSCQVEFETDAANDYFDRVNSPGDIGLMPISTLQYKHLWNGVFRTRFKPPAGSKPGDAITVSISVTDPDRISRSRSPFQSQFTIAITPADHTPSNPGGRPNPPGPDGREPEAPRLAMPNIIEVYQEQWNNYTPPFTPYEALRVMSDGRGGYDYHVNLDNTYLLMQVKQTKEVDKSLIIYWFKWGLALCALGMFSHFKRLASAKTEATIDRDSEETADNAVDTINRSVNGMASVVIPIIRNLYRGPTNS